MSIPVRYLNRGMKNKKRNPVIKITDPIRKRIIDVLVIVIDCLADIHHNVPAMCSTGLKALNYQPTT